MTKAIFLNLSKIIFFLSFYENLFANSDKLKMIYYDFKFYDPSSKWMVINDNVMGGISKSEIIWDRKGFLTFRGNVSLKNGGGFASFRSFPNKWELTNFDGIYAKVRGDDKVYQLRLIESNNFRGVSFKRNFITKKNSIAEIYIPFNEFKPSFRGRILSDKYLIDPSKIIQFGFLISDKQEGSFRLDVFQLGVYKSKGIIKISN